MGKRGYGFGWALLALSCLMPAQASERVALGTTTFVITDVDFTDYLVDGQRDPDLMLVRGQTYVFDLQGVETFHPMFIKRVSGPGPGDTFDEGVTGNGASGEDDITFVVPMDAPNLLFYNCGNHAAMAGNLFIVDPPVLFANGFE